MMIQLIRLILQIGRTFASCWHKKTRLTGALRHAAALGGIRHAGSGLTAIKNTLTANGIDLPFPTTQILFHDQTEEGDGDRTR